MFNYIQLSCKKCEKVLEYAVPSEFGVIDNIKNVPPIIGAIMNGEVIICSCGVWNKIIFDGKTTDIEIYYDQD